MVSVFVVRRIFAVLLCAWCVTTRSVCYVGRSAAVCRRRLCVRRLDDAEEAAMFVFYLNWMCLF